MRTLSLSEQLEVSGGLEEVIVSDSKLSLSASVCGFVGGGSGPTMLTPDGGGECNLEEVVVEAQKMTEQEKMAYDEAGERALANLLFVEAMGAGAARWLASVASVSQNVILAAVGYVPGKLYVGEVREDLLQRMTELEYTIDGLDGAYDGKVDDNKYRFNL